MPNKIRDVLGVFVQVRLKNEGDKERVEISVEPYLYPISYRGEYYVRSGSTVQEQKGSALDRFLLRKQGRAWDEVPVPGTKARSLSRTAISVFRAFALDSTRMRSTEGRNSVADLMESLHLTDGPNLKRAAILAFHSDPEKFIPGAFVKIGYFRSHADLAFYDEIHGNLFGQLQTVLDLLTTKYLLSSVSYDGVHRVETLAVPLSALREAVLNAVIHKDYSMGVPVQISVYSDSLMIWNPGQLPEKWTVEKLRRKHSSVPYNPTLANIFFRAGQIEAWGRGIEQIFTSCKESGLAEPSIEAETSGLWLKFAISKTFVENVKRSSEKSSEKSSVKSSVKSSEKILALMKEKPEITASEMAVKIGISQRAVEAQIRKLKDAGIVQRKGPDKGGYWEVVR